MEYIIWDFYVCLEYMKPTNIRFFRSVVKGKKLRVVFDLQGKQHTVTFGATNYEHYFDKTGLLPKSLNHKDPARRKA